MPLFASTSSANSRPATPRSGGAELIDAAPEVILNTLADLASAQLVIRAGNLSLYRETEFGEFSLALRGEDLILGDDLSGLTIAPGAVSNIYLLDDYRCPPSVEFEFNEEGFSIAVFPESTKEGREWFGHLRSTLATHRASVSMLRSRGAGIWLDEGLSRSNPKWNNHLNYDQVSGDLSYHIYSSFLSIEGSLTPNDILKYDALWRVSDSESHTVIHMLIEDPEPTGSIDFIDFDDPAALFDR